MQNTEQKIESATEEDIDRTRCLLSPKSPRATEPGHLDPETRARLRALLESTGLSKLTSAESKALADPEVLRRLTDKVSSAMDEAASTLMRIKAEQHRSNTAAAISSGHDSPCAHSSSDIDAVDMPPEDTQSCPEGIDQALQGDSLLLMACSAGYYELAQVLLALKSDVEDRGSKGDRTPLMEAASGGYLEIVRLLIAHKANVNAQAASGNTALHYAASGGHVHIARELIIAGARVEEPNENGHTPLMEAATAGQVEVAALLLSRGANINTHSTEFKESALTLACYKGHLEMVKFLLEKGADLEHKTDEMHTALMEASMDGHVDVARLLLDHGAQVNMPADSFESPLTLAACGGHTELAALLIERGANLEEVNDEGYTPLMEAVREGHEEMVTLLLTRGADVNAQTEETQETALTLACCGGFLEIAELLLTWKANIELGCSTPLMEAAQEGHVRLVEYLIKAGANVNAQTFTKGTALTYACENGHTDVAEILIQHGAELDHESEGGRTALMRASKNGHLSTVKFLVGKGACINKTTTANDHTVLSVACANGHQQVVEYLLKSGADVSHKLKDGSTMLIEAAKGGQFDIMNLLLDWPSSGSIGAGVTALPGVCDQLNKEVVAVRDEVANVKSPHPARARDASETGSVKVAKPASALPPPQTGVNGSAESAGGTPLSSSSDLNELPDDQLWEAFFGKMANKGDLPGLGREEQIVVKQQMLDRLMQLERELQERSLMQSRGKVNDDAIVTTALLDGGTASPSQNRNRFMVVNDRLRGDEELAIAILEKAVLGETVLDQVMLEQLKAYIRGGSGDSVHQNDGPAIGDVMQDFDNVHEPFDGAGGDFACDDFDNSSVGSGLSSEGEKFEDACSDDAGQYMVEGCGSAAVPQLDRIEKHMTPQLRRTLDQQELIAAPGDGSTTVSLPKQQIRPSADGADAATLAKSKDHPGTKVSRRMKMPLPYVDNPLPVPVATKLAAAAGGKAGTSQSVHMSELERNMTLQQQRQHLQTQLVLQQQLHDELQQHLRLQQEHQQLQAQLKVKEGSRGPAGDGSVVAAASSTLSSQAQALLSPLDHQCCRHQQPCPQQRHHVQQQLMQLQHQLQQAAGHTNNDSLHQAQQQALKLAQMHQKRNSLQVNVPPQMTPGANNLTTGGSSRGAGNGSSVTQCTQTAAAAPIDMTTKNVNGPVPVTGNAATLAAQKKAADTSTINHMNVAAHNVATGDSNRPIAAARQPTANGTQSRSKVLPPAPCPNCCIDGVKSATSRQTPPGAGNTTNGQTHIDVDAQTDSNHDTALTLAAAGGHTRLVVLLLSRGANVEHRDKKGLTPLILAAAAGHHEVCEVLLANKADIEAQSEKNKDTALSLACANGRLEVVNLLLAKGANKEHRNISDYTPLSQAASGGYVNVIRALLSHGAEINSRTGSKMGISPLMLAAMNGHTTAVKLLLDMGSDINAQIETNRNTALTLACFQGRYEVVSLLIDRKANIEHRAKTGLTPLMEAASGGYVEVGRVLLDKGADIAAAPVPVSRDTALTIAADKGHHRFVELLLSRGAAVDVRNKKGNTPLWLACNGGHVECVQLLVAAGADVHVEDNRRVSCIMAAFRKAHIKVVKVLVRHVTQFPPDQDCLRFIAMLPDKDLVKRCHQCMTLIVSAKEQQAAEANKNAAILLEELSMEREREETKRAAAARKRDKKKLKKKGKSDRSREADGMYSEMVNGDSLEVDDAELDDHVLPYKTVPVGSNLVATSANTCPSVEKKNNDGGSLEEHVPAGISLPKARVKANSPPCNSSSSSSESTLSATSDATKRNSRRGQRDRQKPSVDHHKDVANSVLVNSEPAVLSVTSSSASTINASIIVDSKVSVNGDVKNHESSISLSLAHASVQHASCKDSPKEQHIVSSKQTVLTKPIATNSATGIGDLDDFGSLSIGTSISQATKSSAVKKPVPEKPRVLLVEAKPNGSSKKVMPTQNNKAGSKKGRKDDDWEEVTRKSKRLLVKASVISRVIGRGGCNINAIRDISTAQVEIDRSRDATTERIVTIKGSAEATKYAQELIEKLINDEDKKFEHMLPTMKPLTPSRSSHASQKQKQSSGSSGAGKVLLTNVNGTTGPKEESFKPILGKVVAPVSMPSAWAQPSAAVLQSKPKSSATASNSDTNTSSAWNSNSVSRISPETSRLSYSDWTKAGLASTSADSVGSWSPPVEKMASGVSGSVSSTLVRSEPIPLPIVATSTAAHPGTLVVRPAAVATTIVRDYSPFDNMLSQITESVLAKRPADDFASVAAAGVIVTTVQHSAVADDSIVFPSPTASIAADPNLMAKAPGYRPPVSADPAKAPGHRASKDVPTYGSRSSITTSATSADTTPFQQHDFGRPSSTPTVAASLVEDTTLVGRALGSSLDRPASLYSGNGIYANCPDLGYTPHGSLPPFGANVPALESFASTFPPGGRSINVASAQQAFGAPCSLGSAVNETSVLGAPLMTTSIAMSHGHLAFDDRLGATVTAASSTSADSAALIDENRVESATGLSPIVAAEPLSHNHVNSLDDHRKPLGPIGTERAARRPPAPPSHQPEFPFHPSGSASSMWALTAEAGWNGSLPPLFSTLADHSAAVLAATGLHVDSGSSMQQHSVDFPIEYHGFAGADASAMMISDMYHMDPSMVDQSAMQHMLQTGHPAMLMQFPGDIQTSYNGVLGHAPQASFQQVCPGGFMMAPDNANHMWGISQMSTGTNADLSYIAPKGSQMMWGQNWTPSANM